jgi:hypothetical protein
VFHVCSNSRLDMRFVQWLTGVAVRRLRPIIVGKVRLFPRRELVCSDLRSHSCVRCGSQGQTASTRFSKELAFVETYNREWFLEKLRFKSTLEARRDCQNRLTA